MTKSELVYEIKKLIQPMMLKATLHTGEVGLINPVDYITYTKMDFSGEDGVRVIERKDVKHTNMEHGND